MFHKTFQSKETDNPFYGCRLSLQIANCKLNHVKSMFETIFGWLAFLSLVALPFTHPVRAKSYGPRLIVFLLCVGTTSFGLYILFYVHRLYLLGLAPKVRGGAITISEHPKYAFFLIAIQMLFSVASLVAGAYFYKLGFKRGK